MHTTYCGTEAMQFYLLLSLTPIVFAAKTQVLSSSTFVFKAVSTTHGIQIHQILPVTSVIRCAFFYQFSKVKAKLLGFNFAVKACLLKKLDDGVSFRRNERMWHSR